MCHLNTCCLSLERCLKGGRLDGRDVFGIDGGDGSRHLFFALNAIPHDNGFVEHDRILTEPNVECFGLVGAKGDFLFGAEKTNESVGHRVFTRAQFEGVHSVEVGKDAGAVGCGDRGRGHGIALVVGDASLEFGLRKRNL